MILDAVIPSYCLHVRDTVSKFVQLPERSVRGGENDDRSSADASQFLVVHTLYDFLSFAKLPLLDHSEYRSRVLRESLGSLRSTWGRLAHTEALVAAVSHFAVCRFETLLASPDAAHSSRGSSLLQCNRVRAVAPAALCCLLRDTNDYVASRWRQGVMKAFPTCSLSLLMEMDPDRELVDALEKHLVRQIAGSSRMHESEWASVAARLAANIFRRVVAQLDPNSRVANSTKAAARLRCWRQENWEAAVALHPRLGLSTSCSTVVDGIFHLARKQNVHVMHRSGSGSLPLRGSIVPQTTVLLLRDFTLDDEADSIDCLQRILQLSCATEGSKQQVVVIVIEDDIDKSTARLLQGWSSMLRELHTKARQEEKEDDEIYVVAITAVGKALIYRLSVAARVAPFSSWKSARDFLDTSCSVVKDRWSLSIVTDLGEDSVTSSATRAHVLSDDLGIIFGPVSKSFASHDVFVSAIVCGPITATVDGVVACVWEQLAVLCGHFTSCALVPGHGWFLSQLATFLDEHLTSIITTTNADDSFALEVRLAASLILPALIEAVHRYMELVLQQSFGLSTEDAMSKIFRAHNANVIRCSGSHHAPLVRCGQLYTTDILQPPFFLAEDAEQRERVVLADIAEWCPLELVADITASVFRTTANLVTQGLITVCN